MSKHSAPDFIIAHRGASGSAPENTLAAIRKAHELGCRWVEVDGTVTADDAAVLHHDDDLARCSDAEGLLLAKDLDELRGHDFGSWFDPQFAAERIPTLAECGALCAELGLGCNLEIKTVEGWEEPTATAVCHSLKAHWPAASPLLISSFSAAALEIARDLLPQVPRALLVTVVPRDWRDKLARSGSTALHCGDNKRLSKAAVQELTEAGVPVRVYTVDNPLRAAELRGWGVESIFTNHPERMFDIAEL